MATKPAHNYNCLVRLYTTWQLLHQHLHFQLSERPHRKAIETQPYSSCLLFLLLASWRVLEYPYFTIWLDLWFLVNHLYLPISVALRILCISLSIRSFSFLFGIFVLSIGRHTWQIDMTLALSANISDSFLTCFFFS